MQNFFTQKIFYKKNPWVHNLNRMKTNEVIDTTSWMLCSVYSCYVHVMFTSSMICSREISDKIVCRRFQPSLYRPPAPRFMCIVYSYIVFPHQQHLITFSYHHRTLLPCEQKIFLNIEHRIQGNKIATRKV